MTLHASAATQPPQQGVIDSEKPPHFSELRGTYCGLLRKGFLAYAPPLEQKCPEGLAALRVTGARRKLPVSAAVVAAVVPAVVTFPTTATPVWLVAAIVTMAPNRTAARGDVNYRLARCRSVNHAGRAIRHRRRTINDWRGTTRCGDHDCRGVNHGSGEGNAHRPTRLRRGGEPSYCDHCCQTDQMICFHARFDGRLWGLFRGFKMLQVPVGKSFIEKVLKNE